jgi:hypothetical protein
MALHGGYQETILLSFWTTKNVTGNILSNFNILCLESKYIDFIRILFHMHFLAFGRDII